MEQQNQPTKGIEGQDVIENVFHLENGKEIRDKQTVDSLGNLPAERNSARDDHVTAKTWGVIAILSFIYGLAWWPIPLTIWVQSHVATELGDPSAAYWFLSIYAAMVAVGFLLAGANSDLFGRRMTLIVGDVGMGVGLLLCASAKIPAQFEAGMAISGFFAGLTYMIMCSIPELLPLKYRHVGTSISDSIGFCTVVVAPIAATATIVAGGYTWRWLYWADVILLFGSLGLLVYLYHPPNHPKGVSWYEALRGSDWVGMLFGSAGLIMVLIGIIYTTVVTASDLRVILPLSLGFATCIIFWLWENFSNTKYKLCPPPIFSARGGREFTIPLIVETIISMYYFGTSVIITSMITQFWVTSDTSLGEQISYTLPGNIGCCVGVAILALCGNLFSRLIGFRWATMASTGVMLLCGGILCLVTPFNKSLMLVFVFLQQTCYAYAVIASISLVMWGVHQHDIGIAAGVAGVGRNVGSALAQGIYTTILVNVQSKRAAATFPQAVIDAGLTPENALKLLNVWPLGFDAWSTVPGVNERVIEAADTSWKWSYAYGLRILGLSSLGFGLTAFLLLFMCIDPEPKMTGRIDCFLENDIQASKNEFH